MSDLPPDTTAPHGTSGSGFGMHVDAAPPAPWLVPTAPAAPWAPYPVTRNPLSPQRWLPSIAVASIIAAVVLGGLGLDSAIAAPSAGTVTVGGSVVMTAAPGWVLVPPEGDSSAGIELQKANAILVAEVISSSYRGSSAAMLSDQQDALNGGAAQVSYGDAHQTTISGHDTTYVVFEAVVSSGGRSGVVDGELVCMVVDGNAVVIVVAAPQGHLEPVIDDISAMLKSVRVGS